VAGNSGKSSSAFASRYKFPIERLEDRRLLSATLAVSQSLMVFNAVKATTSVTQTLTLTDTGDAALTLGTSAATVTDDPSLPGGTPRFGLLNTSSIPASLSPGQSFVLNINYNAIAVGIDSAFLNIASNDPVNPTLQVGLRGIGTAGLGGSNQPSLQRILQAYEIPTLVGEAATAGTYPNPPGANSQEVPLQRLVKAGTGPVTLQVLASFTASGFPKSYVLGTYTPGNPANSRQELFYTTSTENQTTYVQPQGSTSFDPGSNSFGFYFVSNVQSPGRLGYSEDSLNTWDTTNPRKFRFFPLENPDGSVVPNAYILTSTEWNAPSGYDFTNMVAIIRNVKAAPGAPSGPVMGLQNLNPLPGTNRMIFSTIQNQNVKIGDTFHNTGMLQVNNTGSAPLIISSFTITSQWQLLDGTTLAAPTFPITIAAGGSKKLAVEFIATSEPTNRTPSNQTNDTTNPSGGGVYTGTLTLNSNDPNAPTQSVPLAGWWQQMSENNDEPDLQTLVNLMAGWSTNINSTPINDLDENTATGSKPTYYGEETVSAYWSLADPSQSISITQLDAFHTQGNTATLFWYAKGSTSTHSLITTAPDSGQTVFPYLNGTTNYAKATLTPTSAAFGFKVDGEWSDDSLNTAFPTGGGHHVRFFPVRDSQGNLVPNTYIMCMDYSAATGYNFDFQDNVYIITNIHPVAVPAAPTDIYATAASQGGVQVEWAPVQDTTLAGYNIYSSSSPNKNFTLLSTTLLTTPYYLDTGAPAGTTRYYRVTAVDSVTSAESLGSEATASATTNAAAPPTPQNFTATGVQGGNSLQWSAVTDPTLKGYNVYSSLTQSGQYTLLTSTPITATSYTDSAAPVGVTTFYQVTAVDGASGFQSGTASANAVAIQNAPIGGLTSLDINASMPGSTTAITSGTDFDVLAGGPGVTGTADGFRYLYQQQTGNFDMRVQVMSITVAGNFSTAGIMARTSLDPASAEAYMSASPTNYRFKDRATSGGTTPIIVGGNTTFPGAWVRLTRVGNLYTGYSSTDGINWTVVSSINLNLGSTVYLGLAVASNSTTSTTTAQLRSYGQSQGVGSIAGFVYSDFSGTGSFVSGDQLLGSWSVYLDMNNDGSYDAGDVLMLSSSTGNYSFTNLPPGVYHVRIGPIAGWAQTQPTAGTGYTMTISTGQNTTGINFGEQQQANISGTVYSDANDNGVLDSGETRLSGWTVFLDTNGNNVFDSSTDPSTTTDANGNYSFVNIPPATWHVGIVTPSGWTVTQPGSGEYTTTLAAGQNVTGENFGELQDVTISGTIFQDFNNNGIQDNGDPALPGWGVFIDINKNGVYDPGIDLRTFADANGKYSFTLLPGTYNVMQNPVSGWARTTPTTLPDVLTLAAGQSATVNFGENQATISGNIFYDYNGDGVQEANEPNLAGWGVFLDMNNNGVYDPGIDIRTFSDANGNYSFTNLAPGSYNVMQGAIPNWVKTTPTTLPDVVTATAGQTTTVNFGENQAAIFGKVFDDADGTGIYNTNDAGLAGWGVFIDNNGNGVYDPGTDIRTFTDANGDYQFVGLAPGTYNVNEGVPTGWTRTTPDLTGYVITLTAGQVVTGQNIGNFPPEPAPTNEIAQPSNAFATGSQTITEQSAYSSLDADGLFELKRNPRS
jgi:SdrD B-like domain